MAKNPKDMDASEIVDALNRLGERAAVLGLLPEGGAKISRRGEFIIDESNVEKDENKKAKRFLEYDKTLHAWGVDPNTGEEGPLTLSVKNRQEEEAAVALGWSVKPLHGPAGRLDGEGQVQAPDPEPEVREFASPGQKQPFEAGSQTGTKDKSAPAPTVAKSKAKPKKK